MPVILDEPHSGCRNIIYKERASTLSPRGWVVLSFLGARDSLMDSEKAMDLLPLRPPPQKCTYAESFANNIKVMIPPCYNFLFFSSFLLLLFKKLVRGESASITTSLYELILCVGPFLSITLPLATFLLHRDEWTQVPKSLAIGAWQDWKPVVEANWAQSPPLQCQLASCPDTLAPLTGATKQSPGQDIRAAPY